MNIPPEIILEKRNSRKKLAIWQFVSLLLIIILIATSYNKTSFKAKIKNNTDYIASILIDDDILLEDQKRDKIIANLANDKYAKALIINLNCPGGSAVASEIIYKSIREIAKDRPVVVVMNSVAASGAYLIALAGDHIIAHNTTITGSIGVLTRSFEVTDLADKIGVKFINIKSNTNKAVLSPTEKFTPEMEAVVRESLEDVYEYFVSLVAERRKLDIEVARQLADGRVYTGNRALKNKLVDAIGTKDDAISWLQKNKNISKELEVVDVNLRPKMDFLSELLDQFPTKAFAHMSSSVKGILMIKE